MGKLGKATVDRIRAMLAAGYSKKETADELGIDRKTVASYAGDTGPSFVQVDSEKVSLSLGDDITKILYDMQGVMGLSSIIGAVKQAYLNTVALATLKVTHWPVYSEEGEAFTAEAMIERLVSFIAYLEKEAIEDRRSLREAESEIERLKEYADEEYGDGYTKASQDHGIYVGCVHCGRPCLVRPRSQAHRAISEMLARSDWGHASCANRAQYESERGARELEAEMLR